MANKAIHFWVTGRVQGVNFRASTQNTAQSLGLSGWVRNLDDGRVEGMAVGPKDQLETLREWLHKGPMFARVDNLLIEEEEAMDCEGFEVLY